MALLVAVGFSFFVSCTKTDDAVMKKTTSNTKKDMVQKSVAPHTITCSLPTTVWCIMGQRRPSRTLC